MTKQITFVLYEVGSNNSLTPLIHSNMTQSSGDFHVSPTAYIAPLNLHLVFTQRPQHWPSINSISYSCKRTATTTIIKVYWLYFNPRSRVNSNDVVPIGWHNPPTHHRSKYPPDKCCLDANGAITCCRRSPAIKIWFWVNWFVTVTTLKTIHWPSQLNRNQEPLHSRNKQFKRIQVGRLVRGNIIKTPFFYSRCCRWDSKTPWTGSPWGIHPVLVRTCALCTGLGHRSMSRSDALSNTFHPPPRCSRHWCR